MTNRNRGGTPQPGKAQSGTAKQWRHESLPRKRARQWRPKTIARGKTDDFEKQHYERCASSLEDLRHSPTKHKVQGKRSRWSLLAAPQNAREEVATRWQGQKQ